MSHCFTKPQKEIFSTMTNIIDSTQKNQAPLPTIKYFESHNCKIELGIVIHCKLKQIELYREVHCKLKQI